MDNSTFSVRIVTADFYSEAPLRPVDAVYSEGRASSVRRVPVLRVFGTTPAGQKACAHIHGLFPYLYVAYDGQGDSSPTVELLEQLAISIDNALQLSLGQGSRHQHHVFKITPVTGIPFYGYNPGSRTFLKILLFSPILVPRLAELLRNGAIMQKVLEPYEAHVPFLLQVFIDYNLYGMSFLNLASVKFRLPLPAGQDGDDSLVFGTSSGSNDGPCRMRWTTSTVSRGQLMDFVQRQTKCELEVDAVARDILNQYEEVTGVVANPGIAAIWKEEEKRRAAHGLPPPERLTSPDRVDVEDFLREKRLKHDLRRIVQHRLASPLAGSKTNSQTNQSEGVLLMSTLMEDSCASLQEDAGDSGGNSNFLLASQSLLLNSGSFAVQLLANLDASGTVSPFARTLSQQLSLQGVPAAVPAQQPPSLVASLPLSCPEQAQAQAQAVAGRVSSRRSSSSSLCLSTFDLQQLLIDAQAASQSAASPRRPRPGQMVAGVRADDALQSPATPLLPAASQSAGQRTAASLEEGVETLLRLRSERQEFLDDSDDDACLLELAELDREESMAMSQAYLGDLDGGLAGPARQSSPTPNVEHELQKLLTPGEISGPQPVTPVRGAATSPRDHVLFAQLLPCNASTPVGRSGRSAPRVPIDPTGHRASGFHDPLTPSLNDPEGSESTMVAENAPVSEQEPDAACSTDEDGQADHTPPVRSAAHQGGDDGEGGNDDDDDDPLQALLLSSTVQRNLSGMAKRLKVAGACAASDSLEKASLLHFKNRVDSTDVDCILPDEPFDLHKCNVFGALDFPSRERSSDDSAPVEVAVMSRFDAYALGPILAPASGVSEEGDDALLDPSRSPKVPGDPQHRPRDVARALVIDLVASQSVMSASGSSPTLVDEARQGGGSDSEWTELEAWESPPSPAPTIESWRTVSLWRDLYLTPPTGPPSRRAVLDSAPRHGLPECERRDARFSNPADYAGPKTVGPTRVCVAAPSALAHEPFDTRTAAAAAAACQRTWAPLGVWRARINEDSFRCRALAAKLDLASVNLLSSDAVAQCGEERGRLASQRPCWLTPALRPPGRKAVLAWSRKRRRTKKSEPALAATSIPRKASAAVPDPLPSSRDRGSSDPAGLEAGNASSVSRTLLSSATSSSSDLDSSFLIPTQILPVGEESDGQIRNPRAGRSVSDGELSSDCQLTAAQRAPPLHEYQQRRDEKFPFSITATTTTSPNVEVAVQLSSSSRQATGVDHTSPASHPLPVAVVDVSIERTLDEAAPGVHASATGGGGGGHAAGSSAAAAPDRAAVTADGDAVQPMDTGDGTGMPAVSAPVATDSPARVMSQRQISISSDDLDDNALLAMLDASECGGDTQHSEMKDVSPAAPSQQLRANATSGSAALTHSDDCLDMDTSDSSGSRIGSSNVGPCLREVGVKDDITSAKDDITYTPPLLGGKADDSLLSAGDPFDASLASVGSSEGPASAPSSIGTARPSQSSASPALTSAPKSALRTSGSRPAAKKSSSSVSFSLAPQTDDGDGDGDTQAQGRPEKESSLAAAAGAAPRRPGLLLFQGKSGSTSSATAAAAGGGTQRTPPAKRRRRRLRSQLDGPTLANEHGFQQSMLDLGEAHSVHEAQHLTLLDVEVHARTRGTLRADPLLDAVCCVFFVVDRELGGGRRHTENGVLMVESSATSLPAVPFSRYAVTVDGHEVVGDERELFAALVRLVERHDPEVLLGYEVQKRSWGYLLQRANALQIPFLAQLSRLAQAPAAAAAPATAAAKASAAPATAAAKASAAPQLEDPEHPANAYNARKMSELRVPGRIVLNVWRLMRHEAALTSYTLPSAAFHLLHVRLPDFSDAQLTRWYDAPGGGGGAAAAHRALVLEFYVQRCHYTMQLLRRLDLVARTSELARLFGLQFYEVLTRGSQFRVESMMLRLTKAANLVAVSPSVQQRARMGAPECVPLILEPESRFYADPVIVLDFQSLYPSMMIAYNYCFSTCLGKVAQYGEGVDRIKFGCSTLEVSAELLQQLEDDITISPNGVVFVKKHVRYGILPRMLDEILSTRIMVKQAMKQCKSDKSVHRMLDHRQLGLKLIANVTYGYTAANFSGRMPCVEVSDSIVRKGRETLERAIQLVRHTAKWGARVVYGDTDSMFIQVPGVSKERAFQIGKEIVDAVTAANPKPVKLKFEKVYYPCILQTKKRYCGYKYESLDQKEPEFEAKGIETVRRDGCPAVVKVLGRSLKLLFSTRDVSRCKAFVQRQCLKVLQGKVNLQDLIIAKEYRGMASYQPTACVPCLEITRRLLSVDRRAEPLVAQRVPYVVICGTPGQPLIQLVRRPSELLEDGSLRLNAVYYITKQLLPPLNRVFHLLGVDVFSWYSNMPHVVRLNAMFQSAGVTAKGNLVEFFSSLHCPVCQTMTRRGVCTKCRDNREQTVAILAQRLNRLETSLSRLGEICKSCCRRQHQTDICSSLDCPVFYRRHQTSVALQIAAPLRDTFLLAPYAMQDAPYGLARPDLGGGGGGGGGDDEDDMDSSLLSCDRLDSSGMFASSGDDDP